MKFHTRNTAQASRQNLSLISLLVAAAILSGCGDKDKAASTQVAAKVNSDEITISQVNFALANLPGAQGKPSDALRKDVLDNLILQNLADQQAIKMKLDRNPNVMQAIENAKNTILARAYMDPIIAGVTKPTADDVHKFYNDHPELFSDRRIFTLRELKFESTPELAAQVRDMSAKGASVDAIATWLKSKNVPAASQAGVKAAEQIPAELLSKLQKFAPGKLMVIEMSKSASVLQVVSTKPEPVSEGVATPSIQEFLLNGRKKEALDNAIKSLKADAKIAYLGEFESGAKAAAEEKPAATESPAAASSAASTVDLSKGVAALK